MGKRKKQKQETPAIVQPLGATAAAPPVNVEQIQQQQQQQQQVYQEQIARIQQQSTETLNNVNLANQQAMAAIQQQLERSNQEKLDYQASLQEYLKKMTEMQQKYTGELSQRDAAVRQQQTLMERETEANSTMNNLLSASTIAGQAFRQRTRRKGFIE